MPALPSEAFFSQPPDWICEVLSPSTELTDRSEKLDIYAEHGVSHAWLAHPLQRSLEVYRLNPSRRYVPPAVTAFVEMAVQRMAPLIQPPFTGAVTPPTTASPRDSYRP